MVMRSCQGIMSAYQSYTRESGSISTIPRIFNPVPGALFLLEWGKPLWGRTEITHLHLKIGFQIQTSYGYTTTKLIIAYMVKQRINSEV